MATFLFGGANGVLKGGWPEELLRVRPDIEGAGGLINLSMAGGGPLSALAQIALARAAQPGDLIIWDHGDGLLGCVKDAAYDPVEALRVVEMFIRGCARRKILVAPVLSERFEEAVSVELEEVPLRLMHLFERFSVPVMSMTGELRASLGARELRDAHFEQGGAVYATARAVSNALAKAVGAHCKQIEFAKRTPQRRNDPIYAASKGVLRVALAANAGRLLKTSARRMNVGPVTAEFLEILPGGAVEFDVEGELLGVAAVIGPEEGVMRISIDSDGYDDLRQTPISLWSPADAPVIGQVSITHLLGRRANLSFPTRAVLRNVSADPGPATIRADYGAAPPTELRRAATIRILALIERRPHQHAPPEIVEAGGAAAPGERGDRPPKPGPRRRS